MSELIPVVNLTIIAIQNYQQQQANHLQAFALLSCKLYVRIQSLSNFNCFYISVVSFRLRYFPINIIKIRKMHIHTY